MRSLFLEELAVTEFYVHMHVYFISWQHILEHGKAEERSEILTKMAGQIVKMSQHKFASNVVEKCLEFGGANERQILIREMLGLTDENEPLQVRLVLLLSWGLGPVLRETHKC
jgi:hypothetical protein